MSKEITKAEFCSKYADVEVKFDSYYKFTFTYSATLPDGKRIFVEYGGNSDDIYRFEVENDRVITVASLDPYSGRVMDGNTQLECFYEY